MCVCVWATGKAFHIQLPEMLLAQNVGIINVAGMAFGEELALVIYGMGRGKTSCVLAGAAAHLVAFARDMNIYFYLAKKENEYMAVFNC